MRKYIVYLTVNTENSNIYVGVHLTEDPYGFDGYIGCGVYSTYPSSYKKPMYPFQHAVKKYSPKKFKRHTLAVFDSEEEAYHFESLVVNEEFIKRKDTYNITVGGKIPPNGSKTLYQFTLSGEFVKEWKNSIEASEKLGFAKSSLTNAASKKKTSNNYLWSYDKEINIAEHNVYEGSTKVYMYDSEGNFKREFSSVNEATDFMETNRSEIRVALASKTKFKHHYFSYEKVEFFKGNSFSFKGVTYYFFTKEGEFWKSFNSPKEIMLEFNVKSISSVQKAVKTGGTYKGYQVTIDKDHAVKNLKLHSHSKKCGQFDLNGNLLQEFDSISELIKTCGHSAEKALKRENKVYQNHVYKLL